MENKAPEQEQAGEKIEAITQADAALEAAGLPTYTQLIATIDGLTAYEVADNANTHDVLVKLVKDAAAALEAHLIAGSTSTADETLNKLLGILDDSKTVAFLRKAGVDL